MEESVADYILGEKNFGKKLEIMEYLKQKIDIFYDNTIIFKALIAKLFIKTMKLDVDENIVVTAMLFCECKKINNSRDKKEIEHYSIASAEYINKLGFNKEFCIICEQHNRYSGSIPRRKESDVLEICDQFGALLLDRPERTAFPIEEALAILLERNLKDSNNFYLEDFKKFINLAKEINV